MIHRDERTWFIIYRITLGIFLLWHVSTLYWALPLLFGAEGLVPKVSVEIFPNILARIDTTAQFQLFLSTLSAAALCIVMGWQRRWAALWLWYGLACITNLAIYLSPPSDGYIGWMCLSLVFFPAGEGLGLHRCQENWSIPRSLKIATWIVVGVTYSASGIDKLNSSLWRSGDALSIILAGPLVREHLLGGISLGAILISLPQIALKILSWGALAIESLYALTLIHPAIRILLWIAMTLMHLCILLSLNITTVSLAMLVCQISQIACINFVDQHKHAR